MAWQPKTKIVTPSAIADNLLAFIKLRIGEALVWAGGSGSSLKELLNVAETVAIRDKPIYPYIAFSDDNSISPLENDVNPTGYSVVFEIATTSNLPAQALADARIYERAVKSLIADCPPEVLLENTNALIGRDFLTQFEVGYEEIRKHDTQEFYNQTLQIRATFKLLSAIKEE